MFCYQTSIVKSVKLSLDPSVQDRGRGSDFTCIYLTSFHVKLYMVSPMRKFDHCSRSYFLSYYILLFQIPGQSQISESLNWNSEISTIKSIERFPENENQTWENVRLDTIALFAIQIANKVN